MRLLKFQGALLLAIWVFRLVTSEALAAGSGLNTVVVVNSTSSNSCSLANYYCERRQVPPENVLRITWSGSNLSWTSDDFQTNLVSPLLAMLASRQLSNQVDFIVLSMDIPFSISYGAAINSTTAALFYGLKPNNGTDWKSVVNSYAFSEGIFRQAQPASAMGYSFLATMLTADTLAQAERIVDQGVNGDSTFPSRRVVLAKTSDPLRNVRFSAFDNAIFNARLRGNYFITRTNSDWFWGHGTLLGCQMGLQNFTLPPGAFAPGAIADNLTSYGGIILGPNSQTSLMAFLYAGAAASYGTVTEPSPDPEKFPDPEVYFYQARGFSIAESYYQCLADPYEGLIVGEPLSAPFAQTAAGGWSGFPTNSVWSGAVSMTAAFSAYDAGHPLQQIDLFVDGKYSQTITNLPPQPGNVLTVTLNGYPLSYTVPTNASLALMATGLASALNSPAVTNVTKISALPYGDRVELRSFSTNRLADPFFFADEGAAGTRFYRVAYISGPVLPQLSLVGRDASGAFRMHVDGAPSAPYSIQASTDLVNWVPLSATGGGSLDFVDVDAPNFAKRFYRVAGTWASPQPELSLYHPEPLTPPHLHIEAPAAASYSIQSSSDLVNWIPLATNSLGGPLDFDDLQARGAPARFYRTVSWTQPPPAPSVGLSAGGGGTLIRVDGAIQPYVVQVSTDLVHWTVLATNISLGQVQTTASSAPGPAGALTSFVNPACTAFLTSPTEGYRTYTANGIFQLGSWLQLNVLKTNGSTMSLFVTNQSSAGTLLDLTRQLAGVINASPELQGADGLAADDAVAAAFGASNLGLRARSPGADAANIQAYLSGPQLVTNPRSRVGLNANLPDLQPRNHLYLTAGAPRLEATFYLDTTTLPDGSHDLTAVAYEGSHVRTQSRSTLQVTVQNTPLRATLSLLDVAGSAPVSGTYHAQVTANTNNVTAITLFTTGGALARATNQQTVTFSVDAPSLGVGRHPFYAVIETASGLKYRTQTQWVRFVTGL